MGNGAVRGGLGGVVIGGAAFVAMGVVAAVGVALSGFGSVVGRAVAVVAAAVGVPLTVVPELPQTASVDVRLHVVATGVTAVGVLVLVLGFRRWPGVEVLAGAACAFAVLLGTAIVVAGGGGVVAEPLVAVLAAVLGVVAVWGLCRVPAVLRPAFSATVLVLGVTLLVVTAAGAVVAQVQDGRVVGAVLLLAPSALFAAITAGIGVPWAVDVDPQVVKMLGGVLPELPSVDLPTWPFTVLAVVLLLVCGTLAAARTAVEDATDLVLRNAAASGLVFGVVSVVMVLLASASADLRLAVRGFVLLETSAGVRGSVWTAVPLGLVAGALAGAAGALLLLAARRVDGTYAGRTGEGGAADGVQGAPRAGGSAAGGRGRPDAAGTPRREPAVRGVRGRDRGRR
ncbi:streptophobe family protein [Umezawaea endophytica]|uniref:Streptophobe family protein n=1 Tax=Umezawaea endophytica TaxID=1654476 RepID=A0A9X3A3M8_9PSEU|nr:streptophobe family protein [Umezawaea endophytica]MCS7481904.1 streptophobe family protein [Umezawaea endophytica]